MDKVRDFNLQKMLNQSIVAIPAFCFFFIIFYIQKEDLYINTLSHINILRAFSWMDGNPYWPGPDIPYMQGNLPGPFFYFLLTPALLFNNPYTALILYTVTWLSLTFTLSLCFIKRITTNQSSLVLFLMLLLTSTVFKELLSLPLNNIFSIFFHLSIMICLFTWREKRNDYYFLLTGLLIGLGVQVHWHIIFHLITSLIFFVSYDKLKKGEFQWKYLTVFMILFFILQLPYLLLMLTEEGYLYIEYYNFQYFNYLIKQFLDTTVSVLKTVVISFDISGNGNWTRTIGMVLIGLISYAHKIISKKKSSTDRSWISLLFIISVPFFLMLPVTDWALNSFFSCFFLILLIKYYDTFFSRTEIVQYLFILIIGFSLIINDIYFSKIDIKILTQVLINYYFVLISIFFLFIGFFFLKIKYPTTIKEALINFKLCFTKFELIKSSAFIVLVILSFGVYSLKESKPAQLKKTLSYIYQETGWNDKQALQRIFQIGFNSDLDFQFLYKLAQEETKLFNKEPIQKTNIGYFVIYDKKGLFYQYANKNDSNTVKRSIRKYLLNFNFPEEIKQDIEKEKINLWKLDHIAQKVAVVSYIIQPSSMFPEGFNNLGKTYYIEPEWSKNNCYFPSLLKDKNIFYLCYIHHPYIGEKKIAFRMNFTTSKKRSLLKVKIIGYPLTVNSDMQTNSQFIKNINIGFNCGQNEERVELLSRIGYNTNKSNRFKSFLAPLEVKIPITCKNIDNINKMKLQFELRESYEEFKTIRFSYPAQ